MTKCLECKHLDLQAHPSHAKTGFGRCKLEKLTTVFVSFSYDRDCKTFDAAKPEVVAKRIAWQLKGGK